MKNIKIQMADFYAKQKRFKYLQSISLHRDINEDGFLEYTAHIVLFDYPSCQENKKFEIIFSGVRNFKMGKIDGLFALFVNIIDISGDQLENISYKVTEEENDMFSFYCKSFSFSGMGTEELMCQRDRGSGLSQNPPILHHA